MKMTTKNLGLFCFLFYHSFYITVWPKPIWTKLSGLWQIPRQNQNTYLRGPESALWNKIYFKKTVLKKFYEVRSERGILIDTDSGSHGYVLWCCGSRTQDFFYIYSDWLLAYCEGSKINICSSMWQKLSFWHLLM